MTKARSTTRLMVALLGAAMLVTGISGAAAERDHGEPEPQTAGPAFVLDRGEFTRFDPPGLGAGEFIDVNDRGIVAGAFVDNDGRSRGFIRDRRGQTIRFDVPGSKQTYVSKVNDRGEIVGSWCRDDPCLRLRGFLREPNGRYRTIKVPRAVYTTAAGLDDRGRVVGEYQDRSGVIHGYVWERGRFKTVDLRRAAATGITGLNDRGEMVGLYAGADGAIHAFHRDRRGQVTTIDSPDLPYTLPFDINDYGRIVGFTASSLPAPQAAEVHGFRVDTRRGFGFRQIDVPGAPRTVAFGIDDRGRVAGFYQNPNVTLPDQTAMPSSTLLEASSVAKPAQQ
jgi:hypothetical protein